MRAPAPQEEGTGPSVPPGPQPGTARRAPAATETGGSRSVLPAPQPCRSALCRRSRRQRGLRHDGRRGGPATAERKSVVSGKSVSVRVDLGGRRIIKKKNRLTTDTKSYTN